MFSASFLSQRFDCVSANYSLYHTTILYRNRPRLLLPAELQQPLQLVGVTFLHGLVFVDGDEMVFGTAWPQSQLDAESHFSAFARSASFIE